MTVISRISVRTHCNDLGGKVWNPSIKWTKKYAVFVVIEDEEGQVGLGECWCFDTAPDTLVAYLRTEICPHLVGTDVDTCPEIYQQLLSRATLTARHGLLASAFSGVDIALWDLRSRKAELPLWEFLQNDLQTGLQTGLQKKTRQSRVADKPLPNGCVYLYASAGLYGENKTVDDLVDEMTSISASGFDIVKMKIGGLPIKEDLERIDAVLNGLPDTCKLIIDGVYSYTEAEALQVYNALPADRIEAFQSPLKADALAGMKTLRDAGVPVMATEAEYRSEIHEQLLQQGCVQYLQTAPIACGGISRLIQLEKMLLATSDTTIKLSLEVSSTAVALLAAAHFAAAHYSAQSDSIAHVEYHFLHQVFFDALHLTQLEDHAGWFQLPEQPGLGIELPTSDTHLSFSIP